VTAAFLLSATVQNFEQLCHFRGKDTAQKKQNPITIFASINTAWKFCSLGLCQVINCPSYFYTCL